MDALKYLQRKKSQCLNPKELGKLDAGLVKYRDMEQLEAKELRRMFMDWDESIIGVLSSTVRQLTNNSQELRQQDT